MTVETSDSSLFSLANQRALVIGGTGVLGGQFASSLASAGAEVIVGGRSEERGKKIVHNLIEQGFKASFIQMDVSNRVSIQDAANATNELGGLDVLVNAAGVNSRTPFFEMSDTEWETLLNINLGAVFRACQIFAPQMKGRSPGAAIINISSASSGPPISRVFGYAAAKAGVNNLTQYLARELAPDGIRVNAIIPGFFPAEQNRALLTNERIASIIGHTPMKRLGNSDELNGTLLWLASSRASNFVTGALVPVDGGFSAMTI